MAIDRPNQSVGIAVEDESQVGGVRRLAVGLAAQRGFDENARSDIAIVATEAAWNIVRHARRGNVLLSIQADIGVSFDILAMDTGPGMADLCRCMEDGYSTTGTAGTGLGAVRRLSDEFDLYSRPGEGTVLFSRRWRRGDRPPTDGWLEVSGISVPAPDEIECGDAWQCTVQDGEASVLVSDGLGHGPQAAVASNTAVRYHQDHAASPAETLEQLHAPLRKTRGAAVGIARLPRNGEQVQYAAVGNIDAAVLAPGRRTGFLSQHGTVGAVLPSVRCAAYDWPRGALLVLASDGLTRRWSLESYRGVWQHHPALMAGLLYRDFGRGRDDATVVILRRRNTASGGRSDR
ncbi:MAG: ATP-binding protein [Planctomycetota bacterium]